MPAFSVATGVRLLQDEGLLPPNPERRALALASPAEATKLGSDGLALRTTATDLAMDDHAADGTNELSPHAMQFLVQDLASRHSAPSNAPTEAAAHQSAYPYGGWASAASESADLPVTGSDTLAGSSISLLA